MDTNKIKSILNEIETSMEKEVEKRLDKISILPECNQYAAENLIHYLTLRNLEIRDLQEDLHNMGLSSMASSESHIKNQLQSIRQRLGKRYHPEQLEKCNYEWSQKNIKEKTGKLFGLVENENMPYIMVTFDSNFASDYSLIKNLILNGMNIARINCAHDDEAVWANMINKIKKASYKTGKPCSIYMDLGGPKIRTQLIGKGKKKGKVKVKEGQLIFLANEIEDLDTKEIIINPGVPEIVNSIKKGDRLFIDDGMIRGVVEKIYNNRASVRITRVSSAKKTIKNEKGLNFPDSELDIAPLTDFDISCIPFICENADMIGYSFARYPGDIVSLREKLNDITHNPPKMVIKIETPQAVKYFPDILLEGLKDEVFGIMIARGDLAVEIGFERMSEIQEEILWISEAAHVPVIWATQVLENLNKSGLATRSEITDVVHAAQAECIMLNKGDHTIEVLETLKDILLRQAEHRNKKRYTFRPLKIASQYLNK